MARVLRRYQSKIYGNYRLGYLKYGSLIGISIALLVLLQHLLVEQVPVYAPETIVTDLLIVIGQCFCCYDYRENLSRRKVMLKELLLLALGSGLIASVVYGLWMWLMCGDLFLIWWRSLPTIA